MKKNEVRNKQRGKVESLNINSNVQSVSKLPVPKQFHLKLFDSTNGSLFDKGTFRKYLDYWNFRQVHREALQK